MKLIKLSFFALTICLSLVNVRVSARQSEVAKNQFLLGVGNQGKLFAQSSENLQFEADRLFREGQELLERSNRSSLIKSNFFEYSSSQNFLKASKIYQQIGNRSQERKTLYKLGQVYWRMGAYEDAISSYQQSWEIDQEIGDLSRTELKKQYEELDYIVDPIGMDYTPPSFYESQRYFLPLLRRMSYIRKKLYGDNLFNKIGDYYRDTKEYDKAIEYYTKILEIENKEKGRPSENILGSLGFIYYLQGDYNKAIEYDKKSNSYNSIGNSYFALGDYSRAIEFYNKDRFPNDYGLAAALSASGKLTEAEKILRNKINEAKNNRDFSSFSNSDYNPAASDATSLNNIGPIDIAYKLIQKVLVARNKFDDALKFSELSRNRSFVRLLARKSSSGVNALSEIDNFDINKIIQIAKKHDSTIVEYSITYDKNKEGFYEEESELFIWVIKPTGEVAFRRVNLKDLSERIDNQLNASLLNVISYWTVISVMTIGFIILIIWLIKSNILVKVFNNHRLKKRLSLPLLISGATCLSVVFLGAIQQQPVLQNRGVQKILENQDATALEKLIHTTHPSNTSENRGLTQILRGETCNNCLKELHKLLITPIADLLPSNPEERIIFITESELSFVPFAALQDNNGKYLIEKHTILTSPSIQALEFTHQRRKELKSSNTKLSQVNNAVVVGNPKMPVFFDAVGKPPKPLDSLPNAEQEANNIAQMLNTQSITGNQATEFYIRQLLPEAQIIHLATHGLSYEFGGGYNGLYGMGYPGAIALTPSMTWEELLRTEESIQTFNSKKDGFLTSGEIVDLKLNAELAVLSACETGRGRNTSEGILGLSRSFIAAGVPSVVVSLWAVNDKSTSDLMTKFYENLQQYPDKAQALRQAMLTTMKKYPSPRHWAAFTLIGEAE
ncbi:MAG: CHAT domain-containing tetratricopeptide repeat protein [Cyanobacteria bacterium J06643_5]